MTDVAYILARLRKIEAEIEEHLEGAMPDDVGGPSEYRSGYYRGRVTAYQRSLALVRRFRRDLAASTARASD